MFVFLVGVAGYFLVENKKTFISLLPKFMTAISLLCIIETLILKTTSITDMFVRRIMFVPCLQNNQYYEYFSYHGIDFYRQSLGGILGKSKYDELLARIIGNVYYGNANVNANNGLFSDAYANLGIIGVFIMPIMITMVLKLMEGAARNIPQKVWTICSIQVFMSFLSSSFFAVLITHGVVLTCIVLYILSLREKVNVKIYKNG